MTGGAPPPFESASDVISGFFPQLTHAQVLQFVDDVCARLDLDVPALAAEARLYLDRDELRGLLARGFEPANHTLTHARCRTLSVCARTSSASCSACSARS